MLTKTKLRIFIVSLSLFSFLSNSVLACGPFFPQYLYTPKDIEGLTSPRAIGSIDTFLESSPYTIISPNWRTEFLYYIYKSLTGDTFTQSEKDALAIYYSNQYFPQGPSTSEAITEWNKARQELTGEYSNICQDCDYAGNCLADAFLTATKTLRERSEIYGKEELRIWLDGQDKVFSNCGVNTSVGLPHNVFTASLNDVGLFSKISGFFSDIFEKISSFFQKFLVKEKTTTEMVERASPKTLLEYDLLYQTAAGNFYKENFTEAEKKFQEIVDNQNNPWRDYASLVLGRIYIREGQSKNPEFWEDWSQEALTFRNQQFEKARGQFERILADPSLDSIHWPAQSLLNFVNFRIDPYKRFRESQDILLSSKNSEEIVYNLEDFALLFPNSYYLPVLESVQGKIDKKFIFESGNDLSKWIYIWQSSDQADLQFAIDQYNQKKSLPWLLASLKLLTTDNPLKDEILSDSLKVSKQSPAYLTAQYYRLNFLIETSEDKSVIKKEVESLLKEIPDKYSVAQNYFTDLRMTISDSLQESLSYSMRKIVSSSYDYEYYQKEDKNFSLIDENAKKLFNELLSLEKWNNIASGDIFPEDINKQIRIVTLIRAVLLGNFDIADNMANLLSASDSNLRNDLSDFIKASNLNDKKFTIALFLLKYPRLSYILDSTSDEILVQKESPKEWDEFRRNWWRHYSVSSYDTISYDASIFTKYLSDQDIVQAKSENEKIYKIPAPNFIGEIVIDYTLKNPNDPRVPEALHLTVEATHYADFKDGNTGSISQRAFQILHENYPQSYWAGQTPYWY